MLLRLQDEPQASKAWAKGAAGERLVGDRLDALAPDGVISLHDRRRPGTRANIDHIAVAPTGIYVVDAKHYRGRLERRDVGSLFRSDERLCVNGRDRTALTEGVLKQATAVRAVLGDDHRDVPIWAILCFVNVEVGLLTRPFVVNGVGVTWPRAMQKAIARAGPVGPEVVQQVAAVLGHRLRPA